MLRTSLEKAGRSPRMTHELSLESVSWTELDQRPQPIFKGISVQVSSSWFDHARLLDPKVSNKSTGLTRWIN